MKRLIILSAFFTAIFLSGSLYAQEKTSETMVIKTNIYCDHCLECNDCGGKLVHDLSFLKGVKKNSVDPVAMTITITYNPKKTTPDLIRQAISKMGYDADEIKADSKAYSMLDECCKKK